MPTKTWALQLVALLATVSLAACGSTGGDPQAQDSPNRSQEPTDITRGSDQIARYALSAQPGDSAQIQLSDKGSVFVTVGGLYTSAAGTECRRITVRTQRDASRVSAVCRDGDVWRTVLMP
jgi:hypothetical protein